MWKQSPVPFLSYKRKNIHTNAQTALYIPDSAKLVLGSGDNCLHCFVKKILKKQSAKFIQNRPSFMKVMVKHAFWCVFMAHCLYVDLTPLFVIHSLLIARSSASLRWVASQTNCLQRAARLFAASAASCNFSSFVRRATVRQTNRLDDLVLRVLSTPHLPFWS